MSKKSKFVPYRSKKNGKWYWKLMGRNGKKVAGGVEWFAKKPGQKELDMLKRIVAEAVLEYEKK
jgi:hypothetical protein